ncbi:unnamed protein product [Calypogeia fissa]
MIEALTTSYIIAGSSPVPLLVQVPQRREGGRLTRKTHFFPQLAERWPDCPQLNLKAILVNRLQNGTLSGMIRRAGSWLN